MRFLVPWSFLGLFASPAKLLVVVGAVVALAWRTGWFQRFLIQVLTRRMSGEPARPQPRSASTAAPATTERRRWNWRAILLVFLIVVAIILVVSRAHVTRMVAPTVAVPSNPAPSHP